MGHPRGRRDEQDAPLCQRIVLLTSCASRLIGSDSLSKLSNHLPLHMEATMKSVQLLDAPRGFETIDRRFQKRSRAGTPPGQIKKLRAHSVSSRTRKGSSHESGNNI